jgi:hypothetical protein
MPNAKDENISIFNILAVFKTVSEVCQLQV